MGKSGRGATWGRWRQAVAAAARRRRFRRSERMRGPRTIASGRAEPAPPFGPVRARPRDIIPASRPPPAMDRDTIVILDFGSQYTQLIARRLRELQVYSEILPPTTTLAALRARGPRGIVLSGGPDSVYEKGAPRVDRRVFGLGVPVLGICYGMQLMSHVLGGEVKRAGKREYGHASFEARDHSPLLRGFDAPARVWMSHGDSILQPPAGFSVTGSSHTNPVAAIEDPRRRLFGILFHPEVKHSERGMTVLANFLDICGCRRDWNAASFVEEAVAAVRAAVGGERVLCALSGGVDSAVAALVVHRAIGE